MDDSSAKVNSSRGVPLVTARVVECKYGPSVGLQAVRIQAVKFYLNF